MKKLIKDLLVGDEFYYCNCWKYQVVEILSDEQILVKKTVSSTDKVFFTTFSRTEEEVELVEKTKLRDLFVGARFKFTNSPYANPRVRTVLYKDDMVILYVLEHGEYVLSREGDLSHLLDEEVEVIPYVEEA